MPDAKSSAASAVPAQPARRRAALVFIFVTVMLDMLALGMIIPVLPKLVERFMGGNTAAAAEVFGLFNTVWALMQFFFSPVLGALSDRYGRRPVILLSNFGLGLDYVLMAVAPTLGARAGAARAILLASREPDWLAHPPALAPGTVRPCRNELSGQPFLLIGLLFGTAGLAIFGLAPTGTVFLIGLPVMALWGFASPAAQGLMTWRVSPAEQGQLQGANSSIMGIANLVGPAIFTLTFAHAIGSGRETLAGAPFLLSALMLLASAALAWHATRPR
jgi:MFS family permease